MSGIMSMLLGAVSSAAAAADEFFNRVTLLLNTGSTNGAQNNTFLDSSSNNFSITRNGNTTQGTFTPFSQTGWSNNFSGTSNSNYLSVSRLLDSTVDITLEFWIYPTAGISTNGSFIASQYDGTADRTIFYMNTGNVLTMQFGTTFVNSTAAIQLNAWTHIAFVRSGNGTNNWSQYINGTRDGQATYTGSYANQAFTIGASPGIASNQFQGYISNMRLIKGSALYSGTSFTVPTSPFITSTTNQVLLTCASNSFTDINTATTAKTITAVGTPSVQAFSPFAPTAAYSTTTVGGSGYFDGTGDYLSVPTNTAFAFGTGAATIEAWIYDTGTSATFGQIFGSSTFGVNNEFLFSLDGSTKKLYAQFGATGGGNSTGTITSRAWTHVAVVRSGTTVTFYINGSASGSYTDSDSVSSTIAPTIGASSNTNANSMFIGYISDLRVLKGTAATISIPTAPLTNITNTSFLLNATNAGIYDAAAKNVLETVGNAQVSTTQAKFGTTSMYFDGTGDYLITPSSTSSPIQSFSFPGDYTIECWVRTSSFSTNQGIFDTRNSGASTLGVTVFFDTNSKIILFMNGLTRITSSASYSTNTWYHIALVRSGSTNTLYVDGTSVGTYTFSSSLTDNSLTVGSVVDFRDTTSTYHFNGYIDDLRITKGYARYTTTFTPPTAAFPIQ